MDALEPTDVFPILHNGANASVSGRRLVESVSDALPDASPTKKGLMSAAMYVRVLETETAAAQCLEQTQDIRDETCGRLDTLGETVSTLTSALEARVGLLTPVAVASEEEMERMVAAGEVVDGQMYYVAEEDQEWH